MGRKGSLFGSLAVALSLTWQTAQAGDHRSVTAQSEKGSGDTAVSTHQFLSNRQDTYAFDAVKPTGEVVAAPAKSSGDPGEKNSATTEGSARKQITFFRFNSRVGEVAFQPVVGGGAKGAQFSIGF